MGFLKTEQCSVCEETMYIFLKLPLSSWIHSYAGCVIIHHLFLDILTQYFLEFFYLHVQILLNVKRCCPFSLMNSEVWVFTEWYPKYQCLHTRKRRYCIKSNNITYVFVIWGTLKMNDNWVFPKRRLIKLTVCLAKLAVFRSRGLLLNQNRQFLPAVWQFCDSLPCEINTKLHSQHDLPSSYLLKKNKFYITVYDCLVLYYEEFRVGKTSSIV